MGLRSASMEVSEVGIFLLLSSKLLLVLTTLVPVASTAVTLAAVVRFGVTSVEISEMSVLLLLGRKLLLFALVVTVSSPSVTLASVVRLGITGVKVGEVSILFF